MNAATQVHLFGQVVDVEGACAVLEPAGLTGDRLLVARAVLSVCRVGDSWAPVQVRLRDLARVVGLSEPAAASTLLSLVEERVLRFDGLRFAAGAGVRVGTYLGRGRMPPDYAEEDRRRVLEALAGLDSVPLLDRPPPGRLVYFVRAMQGGPVKIGVTGNLAQRLNRLEYGEGRPVRALATVPGGVVLERFLHVRYAELRRRGEWFELDDDLRSLIAAAGRGVRAGASEAHGLPGGFRATAHGPAGGSGTAGGGA